VGRELGCRNFAALFGVSFDDAVENPHVEVLVVVVVDLNHRRLAARGEAQGDQQHPEPTARTLRYPWTHNTLAS